MGGVGEPEEQYLSVSTDPDGTVVVTGEVDLYSAPQLEQVVDGAVEAGEGNVVIDLAGVRFMDSAGLNILIRCFKPLDELVGEVNQSLRGWKNYFSYGYPRRTYRKVNTFVVARLTKHLRRRSQRACRPPAGMSYYGFLTRRLGLRLL